ncbi:RNA 2',3'-cyclic phosphodiesterase [Lujinxingia litoralis]|nr:RNA 2',3'-cyclic phosphodiesterase [Lujinxingia litoralis]
MRRLFIAVDLSINVVERLVLFQDELRERLRSGYGDDLRVRWTHAENIHLTMKFLGDTSPELVSMLESTLQRLTEPLFPFEVECRGFGAFPEPARPRILWAGLDAKSAEVFGLLQQALERDLQELGVPADPREFLPHITLGRLKSRAAPNLAELQTPFESVSFGKSYIKDLVLYESHLRHDGPRYQVVSRFPLGTH